MEAPLLRKRTSALASIRSFVHLMLSTDAPLPTSPPTDEPKAAFHNAVTVYGLDSAVSSKCGRFGCASNTSSTAKRVSAAASI
eukprot:7385052-Prymnesium_polylepis.6